VDKYFFSLTACNKEGWVPMKTILTFKRMAEFQPLGVPFAAYALRQAALAEGNDPLVAVSDDGENVRRKRPLEPNSTAWGRSVYVVRLECQSIVGTVCADFL
jgi:lupus La protein